jgi:hypothetical protein
MVALVIVLAFSVLDRLDRLLNPRPLYAGLPHALQIVQSRMNWAQTKDGLRIYMTGILTNQSAVSWRDIEFECRFYDSAGVMVDAAHSHGYLTVQPGDDTAFRVVVAPGCATNDYRDYKLLVTTARNARGWF